MLCNLHVSKDYNKNFYTNKCYRLVFQNIPTVIFLKQQTKFSRELLGTKIVKISSTQGPKCKLLKSKDEKEKLCVYYKWDYVV